MERCPSAGILENILGKVLAAFQGRMSDLLGVTACKALSEDSALAVQMAAEPCAPQAGRQKCFLQRSQCTNQVHVHWICLHVLIRYFVFDVNITACFEDSDTRDWSQTPQSCFLKGICEGNCLQGKLLRFSWIAVAKLRTTF